MSSQELRIEWAVRLASMGFKVIPLKPRTKEPVQGSSWLSSMTSDPAIIQNWTQKYPDCNFGIVPYDRHVIIDLDQKEKKRGIDNFEKLESEQDFDQIVSGQTLTVATPSGGKHLYLSVSKAVGNASAFGAGSGIDVRGRHGYVVGPYCYTDEDPSTRTYEGEYTIQFDDADIIAAPTWIVENLKSDRARDEQSNKPLFELDHPDCVMRAKGFLANRKPAVEGENGNDHSYATVVLLKDLGLSADGALELLMEPGGWNEKCSPPWDSNELETLIENAYAYGKNRPGSKGGMLMEKWDAAMAEAGIDDDMVDVSTIDFDALEKADAEKEKSDIYAKLREITFLGNSIVERNIVREMVIPEYMVAHGVGLVLAKRGMGKTTTLVDLAMRISCDMEWHDVPCAKDWAVIYICGEDDEGAEVQIKAWQKHHRRTPNEDRFIFMAGIMNLISASECEHWGNWLKMQIGDRRAVIIADTWQRATIAGSQNDDEQMAGAMTNLEKLGKRLRGPAVAAVHPPKHDGSITMGSSVIENSSSFIWVITQDGGTRRVAVNRIKGKGTGNYGLFTFKEVFLGVKDQFGTEISSVVPVKHGGLGIAVSAEHIKSTGTVRELYAHLIKDLIIKAEDDADYVKNREAHFGVGNTSDRIVALESEDPDNKYLRALKSSGESWPTARALRDRLTSVFEGNSAPVDLGDDVGSLMLLPGKNRSKCFRIKAVFKKMSED